MKTKIVGFAAAVSLLTSTTLAQADVIIPDTGLIALVAWSGMGGAGFGLTQPVDSINGIAGPSATITVPTASRITFSLNDFGVSGDALALTLDVCSLTRLPEISAPIPEA